MFANASEVANVVVARAANFRDVRFKIEILIKSYTKIPSSFRRLCWHIHKRKGKKTEVLPALSLMSYQEKFGLIWIEFQLV